jgi:streptogramin lyase
MNLDGRGRHVGQVTRQLAEARGPVPPFALVRRRHQRRARRHAAVLAAAAITAAAVVTFQVGRQAGEDVVSRPRSPGRVAAVIRVGGQPSTVRADADAVWVARGPDLVRVDPRTNRVVAKLSCRCPQGSALAAFGAGSLWLTQVAQGTVTRVDPATGRTVATIRVPGAEAPLGIDVAVGAGAVWVMYDLGVLGGTIVARVDPATNSVAATVKLADSETGFAVSDQTVLVVTWTTQSALAYQIDAATSRVVARIPVCHENNDVAFGSGAFWVGCGEGRLLRVDPVAHRVAATVELGGAAGSASTVCADGDAVWVANLGDVLLRIDPQTNTVLGSLPATGSPGSFITDMAVGAGAVWLTTSGGTLVRFDPNG